MICEESRTGLSALGGGAGESLQRPVGVTYTPRWGRHGSTGLMATAGLLLAPRAPPQYGLALWAGTPFPGQAPGTRTAALCCSL